MAFHPDNCIVLTITNKKNPVKHNYLLHNHNLESVSSTKYLGITLQSDLKWTQHTNNIVANANKSFGFLKRNLKTSNTNIKSHAYLSLVRPKLEYACSVWDPHTAEYLNKIEMVQRQAAKYACNRYHNTSGVTDMLQTPTTILIPTDSRIRQSHPFTYRYLHAFKDPLKYSFFPNTIIYWNLLPQNIVLCPTVNTFREQLTPTVLSHLQSQI